MEKYFIRGEVNGKRKKFAIKAKSEAHARKLAEKQGVVVQKVWLADANKESERVTPASVPPVLPDPEPSAEADEAFFDQVPPESPDVWATDTLPDRREARDDETPAMEPFAPPKSRKAAKENLSTTEKYDDSLDVRSAKLIRLCDQLITVVRVLCYLAIAIVILVSVASVFVSIQVNREMAENGTPGFAAEQNVFLTIISTFMGAVLTCVLIYAVTEFGLITLRFVRETMAQLNAIRKAL